MRIGINQFCFPAPCDVSEALHRAKGLGYDCMEICLTADRKPGPAVWNSSVTVSSPGRAAWRSASPESAWAVKTVRHKKCSMRSKLQISCWVRSA